MTYSVEKVSPVKVSPGITTFTKELLTGTTYAATPSGGIGIGALGTLAVVVVKETTGVGCTAHGKQW